MIEQLKQNKVLLLVLGSTLLILIIGMVAVSRMKKSPKIEAAQNVEAVVENSTHFWGETLLNGGDVSKTFKIKNEGEGVLELANVKTSCMCTTAQVKTDGETSPFFGMHSSSSWIGEVKPGREADLKVVFDPAYHGPSGVGSITREVVLETNDPENSRLTFTLSAEVVKK